MWVFLDDGESMGRKRVLGGEKEKEINWL